ncbi:MAG TPA: hypothetical protein VKS60_04385, partial [Stellaceae bacterium]|nr:hypothetical protein [Stellaceae bacterium]
MSTSPEARLYADDPEAFFGKSGHASQHLPWHEMNALQLEAMKLRFGELRDRLPVLKTLADEAGI